MQSLDVLHLTLGQVKSIRWSELPSTIGLLMVRKRLKCIKIGLWLQGANFEVLQVEYRRRKQIYAKFSLAYILVQNFDDHIKGKIKEL